MAGRTIGGRVAARWSNRLRRRVSGRKLPIWYAAEFRPPVPEFEHVSGFEPRRADLVLWSLLDLGLVDVDDLHTPQPIAFADLARVHSVAHLEAITQAETLARTFAADADALPVDALVETLRLACGATLAATRYVLEHGGPALTLLGGFHHAAPERAGGFSAVNDMATAIAVARAEGFDGQVVVLDLDAHPPDGTADCLLADDKAWIGSLSGPGWPAPPNVDETVLPEDCDDATYLDALQALLARAPRPDLTIVVAGGDVLAEDALGKLGLSLDGAAERDLQVAQWLTDRPAVWLPAGGYGKQAWRALAGTATALILGRKQAIHGRYDPMQHRFAAIAADLDHLDGQDDDAWLTDEDVAEALGMPTGIGQRRLLGYYTAQGVELALSRYGVLPQLARLGYGRLRVAIEEHGTGDALRLYGRAADAEHLLLEAVLARDTVAEQSVLYVNWMTLRHPLASFHDDRPRLPGQEVPGLGMAREAGHLLARMAERLDLKGVAFRPASFHVAYAARSHFRFADAARQGQFLALIDHFGDLPLLRASCLVDAGEVAQDGSRYAWQADLMVHWLDGHGPGDAAQVAAARRGARWSHGSDHSLTPPA